MSIPGVPDEFEELMPCPACPDGYVWNSNGPTRKLCPVCKGLAAVGYRAAQTEQTSGETPSASEQANASVPESRTGPLDHQPCIERGCPNPSLMPKSEYCAYHARREPQQSAATPSPTTEFLGTIGAAQAATDGPAADPIADLCERLRYIGMFEDDRRDGISPMCREAADALERLARENAALRAFYGDQHIRDRLANAEQVETENDALRAIVRAADWMRRAETGIELAGATMAYDRARAAWKGEGQ